MPYCMTGLLSYYSWTSQVLEFPRDDLASEHRGHPMGPCGCAPRKTSILLPFSAEISRVFLVYSLSRNTILKSADFSTSRIDKCKFFHQQNRQVQWPAATTCCSQTHKLPPKNPRLDLWEQWCRSTCMFTSPHGCDGWTSVSSS